MTDHPTEPASGDRIELPGGYFAVRHQSNDDLWAIGIPEDRIGVDGCRWLADAIPTDRMRAFAAALRPPPSGESEITLEEWWQDHVDKNDRNSPEEYPEMILVTFEEMAQAMAVCSARTHDADAAALRSENERLNSDHERTVRLLLRSGEEINHQTARAEKAETELARVRARVQVPERQTIAFWRNNAFENAAQIVERYFGDEARACAADIRALLAQDAQAGLAGTPAALANPAPEPEPDGWVCVGPDGKPDWLSARSTEDSSIRSCSRGSPETWQAGCYAGWHCLPVVVLRGEKA